MEVLYKYFCCNGFLNKLKILIFGWFFVTIKARLNIIARNNMGYPSIYYKRALQCFAHALVYMEDSKLAKELSEEKLEEKLEKFILEKKKTCDEKQFYYDAGRTAEYVSNEADKEGCDAFNACLGGLNMFHSFIGLETDTD